MPIGTLRKKIQLQSMCSVMRPPISGPMASAIADTPAQIPIAIPRWCGGNVAEMIESVAGIMIAAPTPWRVRAPMSVPPVVARPHASDESVKIASPIRKTRRRPKKSASLPPESMSTAKVSA